MEKYLNNLKILLNAILDCVKTTKEKIRMKTRIEGLSGIGTNARKITTEIGGNYAICVSTEAAKKTKNLCVYESSKGLSFEKGSVHQRKLVKAFPYSSEEGYVGAYKSALKYIAVLEDKIAV
jgi:hypothetical protein